MRSYTHHFGTVATPQTEPIPGQTMVRNEAGGYAFPVDDWTRLDRFLILGSEGGSYYTSERRLTIENAEAVVRCAKKDGLRTVERIRSISLDGRSPKAEPTIFALAICAKLGDEPTRRLALSAVQDVCRIGTHLFAFAEALQAFGGWGRGTRTAIGDWYGNRSANDLAYQLIKYRQRNGWTHRDLLRLAHPTPDTDERSALYRWTVKGDGEPHPLIAAYEALQTASEKQAAVLIRENRLPREAVPTELLNSRVVWEALAEEMPITALIRNLGKMSAVGLIAPLSEAAKAAAERITDVDRLRRGRVHPMQLLAALRTYSQGHGEKGSLAWNAEPRVVAALDAAFYSSFANVEATGKRFLLGVDVSGSMHTPVSGLPMDATEAAASVAFIVQKTEPNAYVLGFHTEAFPLDFTPIQRVDDAVRHVRVLTGGTDCSAPIRWAAQNHVETDVIGIFTDEETWAGPVHVVQALMAYRQMLNPQAKLVSDNFVATGSSVVDGPEDAGVLRVVGFDTNVPALISDFAR